MRERKKERKKEERRKKKRENERNKERRRRERKKERKKERMKKRKNLDFQPPVAINAEHIELWKRCNGPTHLAALVEGKIG